MERRPGKPDARVSEEGSGRGGEGEGEHRVPRTCLFGESSDMVCGSDSRGPAVGGQWPPPRSLDTRVRPPEGSPECRPRVQPRSQPMYAGTHAVTEARATPSCPVQDARRLSAAVQPRVCVSVSACACRCRCPDDVCPGVCAGHCWRGIYDRCT